MSGVRDLLLGVDAGGTSVHVAVEHLDGTPAHEEVIESARWSEASFAQRAELVAGLARAHGDRIAAVGVGAHGCDSDGECRDLHTLIDGLLGPDVSTSVVNDAELLGYAHGTPDAVNVILGTGSIVVSRAPGGAATYLGGWGWLVGDDGSAWGLVRNSVRELTLSGAGRRVDDRLFEDLRHRTGIDSLRDLVDEMQQQPASTWAGWAQLVFAAAAQGSAAASAALEIGVDHTLDLVAQALKGNPTAPRVLLGGGVITHQSGYAARIREMIAERFALDAEITAHAPVRGALALARTRLLARR